MAGFFLPTTAQVTTACNGATIPEFPAFAPLTIAQSEFFHELVRALPPYEECSQISWHLWFIAGNVRVAQLHGNLVLSWSNSENGQSFYTFLGATEPEKTAAALLAVAESAPSPAELRLLPEEAAKSLSNLHFTVEEDREHFDYILDATSISEYRGNKYQAKRRWVNHFGRRNGTRVAPLDLSATSEAKSVIDLHSRWKQNKSFNGEPIRPSVLWGKEPDDMCHLFPLGAKFGLLTLGIWSAADELIACSISECVQPGPYAIIHFIKADTRIYHGSFEVMMQETAKMLLGSGCSLINFGPDLGIPSLRTSKLRYRPIAFLKKYTVKRVASAAIASA